MHAPEAENPKRAEHRVRWEAADAVRGHLVTANQEAPNAVVDMIVHRPVRRQAGAMAEIRAPAAQQAIEPVAYLGPGAHVAGDQDVADLGLEPQHALRGGARSQVPMAILPVVMRAEAVAKEVETFAPGIPDRGLRLVESEPEPGHHRARP